MENDKLLHKWVNGTINAEELATFKQRPEYESLASLYKHTADFTAPALDEQEMLNAILKEKKETQRPAPAKIVRMPFIKYLVAASVLFFGGWFLWSNLSGEKQYLAKRGEQLKGQLPDQSTFILNAQSHLAFKESNWTAHRQLKLHGEAFFNVKKGSTFSVMTNDGKVVVLGTQFNVRSRNRHLDVECKSGSVSVYSKKGQLLKTLKANDGIRIHEEQVVVEWKNTNNDQRGWVDGISKLKDIPFSEILRELERQFNIRIDHSGIDTSPIITCSFPHDNLDAALKIALEPMGLKYTKTNDKQVSIHK